MKRITFSILSLLMLIGISNAQSLTPEKVSGNKYSISVANVYFEVDGDLGARVKSFQADNTEILKTTATDINQIGSTFWPSPQKPWNWPPIAILDNKPYTATISGDKITFRSQLDTRFSLRFYKTMYASAEDTSITIEYYIKNEKTTAQSWAPWEVTRVLATGLTVFSTESGSVTGTMSSRAVVENGYVWYDQDTKNSPGNKFFADGNGWIGHVTTDNVLFLKKFPNIPATQAAKDEAEIEVYTIENDAYSELENQGAYTSIPAKDSITWKVKWYARALPQSVTVEEGSKTLTDYIQRILSLSTNTVAELNRTDNEYLRLSPNPASDKVFITAAVGNSKPIQVRIMTLEGKLVLTKVVKSASGQIDLSSLAPGIYLYTAVSENKPIANGKLLISR